jgi:ureidoglycolate hydrolase
MKILPVTDPSFAAYGKVVEGYDFGELLRVLDEVSPLPEGVVYVPDQAELKELAVTKLLASNEYGGMPIQMGYCNGHNTKLNCLEYHRDSELNLGTEDFILLVAGRADMENGRLDTGRVKAFLCPAGVMVEVYATTLHYAPCSAKKGQGFKVLIVLPEGTNGPKPETTPLNDEDRTLWACNKWLLAHAESAEAKDGAPVLLDGENIDIAGMI